MKTKKILTANLTPGMVTAEAAYTYTNHIVIQSNTVLTEDIIDKLKYYAVKSVKILVDKPSEETDTQNNNSSIIDNDKPTYFERIQASEEFKGFNNEFNNCIDSFRTSLNDMVVKSSDGIVDSMLEDVSHIIEKTRNPLHMLDMMQCMRGYDDLTYTHSMNVALICNVLGKWLHLSENDLNVLTTAGLLHDIGKLKIPEEIIKKPDKLTDYEFEQIQNHPQYGYDILRSKRLDSRVKLAALQHHERFDGKGYPNHLAGHDIDYIASIVAIADVYDAMTSDRCYRKGICPFPVLEELERTKDRYEPSALYTFMEHTVEAYINTEVMLSNGEKGRVILINNNFLSRPIVITSDKTYDLSKDSSIQITSLI